MRRRLGLRLHAAAAAAAAVDATAAAADARAAEPAVAAEPPPRRRSCPRAAAAAVARFARPEPPPPPEPNPPPPVRPPYAPLPPVDRTGDSAYTFYREQATFSHAVETCEAQGPGWHLARVESVAERDWLRDRL